MKRSENYGEEKKSKKNDKTAKDDEAFPLIPFT